MYSVRMRAAEGHSGGRHISGAERLVTTADLFATTNAMLTRALTHSRGKADFIQLTVEKVEERDVVSVPLLPVRTVVTADKTAGLAAAGQELVTAGVSEAATGAGIEALRSLPDSMRGAMILCGRTGRRLDNGDRGIRVSRLDAADKQQLEESLRERGLPVSHLPEALVLASKVVSASGVIAELCWSDDPEYKAGYVASARGYTRFSNLKDYGDPVGGRVFFVEPNCDLAWLREYLEKQAVLVLGEAGQ